MSGAGTTAPVRRTPWPARADETPDTVGIAGQEEGPRLYAELTERFDAEVGELTPESLVAACTR